MTGKDVVMRLIEEVMNRHHLDVLDELYAPGRVAAARRWIEPFLRSFPDVRMEVVTLVAEGDTVVGRFRCSGTHLGLWRGHPPTGRRFHVSEVYFFIVVDGLITQTWGLENDRLRFRQLGLTDGETASTASSRQVVQGTGRR